MKYVRSCEYHIDLRFNKDVNKSFLKEYREVIDSMDKIGYEMVNIDNNKDSLKSWIKGERGYLDYADFLEDWVISYARCEKNKEFTDEGWEFIEKEGDRIRKEFFELYPSKEYFSIRIYANIGDGDIKEIINY